MAVVIIFVRYPARRPLKKTRIVCWAVGIKTIKVKMSLLVAVMVLSSPLDVVPRRETKVFPKKVLAVVDGIVSKEGKKGRRLAWKA